MHAFFEHPNLRLKMIGKTKITNVAEHFCLSKPVNILPFCHELPHIPSIKPGPVDVKNISCSIQLIIQLNARK